MVGAGSDPDGRTDSSSTIDRRDVLRSTAGLAVGAGGVTALSGGSSAQIAALLEALNCAGSDAWDEAPADYPVVDLQTSTPSQIGDWPDDPDDLTIFVHGLGGDSNEGWKRQAVTFENAAEANGWDPTQVCVLYQTMIDGSLAWSDAVDLAKTAGQRMASWLRSYDDQHDVSSYNIVAHSLGGHVTGALLNDLGGDVVIDNVATIGPAIPQNSVCQGSGEYASGIADSAGQFHNYHSENDAVVCDLYSSTILGSGNTGLGCQAPDCGWFASAPSNFTDHDVSDSVAEHCDYPKADVGCVPQILDDFGVGGGTGTGGSGGSGSGGTSGGSSGGTGGWFGSGGSTGGTSGSTGGTSGTSGSSSGGSSGSTSGSSSGDSGGWW